MTIILKDLNIKGVKLDRFHQKDFSREIERLMKHYGVEGKVEVK